MAINFEAANMAGYNNPKIEVFKAALAEDGKTLAQYPAKAAIIAAMSRGSFPVILLAQSFEGTDAGYVLHLHSWTTDNTGDAIDFCAASQQIAEVVVSYPAESDTPVFRSTV